MSTGRNRSEGWAHAKKSGHENEERVRKQFDDPHYCRLFSQRLGIATIVSAEVGGIHERKVEGVLGRTSKSKTDLRLTLEDGKVIRISIKKEGDGQVDFHDVDSFVQGIEKQFSTTIPSEIQDLLHLFFFGNPNTQKLLNNPQITIGQSDDLIALQKKQNRLVWTSLENWDNEAANRLLQWFKDNISILADYCFSKGLSSSPDEWADYVWFINLLGEKDLDTIFTVKDILEAVSKNAEMVCPGFKNGGSTIQLPFGMVEWHQRKMQFHDSFRKLIKINTKQL